MVGSSMIAAPYPAEITAMGWIVIPIVLIIGVWVLCKLIDMDMKK